jgi:cell division septum initiation protein DivIVA
MEITPRELRDVEIRAHIRGYHPDDVNELMERAAATIESANERINQLTERISSLQGEAGRTRETEDILHRTLLLAQRAADEAVAEATAKSRQMLDDAEIQARRLVADAESDARRKGEFERQRLEGEILELAGRRDALLADVEALTRFEAEYRERMVRALEADLFALRSRPTTAPGSRPETSEVDLPVPGENSARHDAIAETSAPETATHEVDVRDLFDSGPAPAVTSAHDAPASEEKFDTSDRGTFTSPTASAPTPTPTSTPAPAPTPAPATAAAPASPPAPIDLLANDGADADVLDDDAFFATLRDAVHDDAPLGPREEEERFFDQDADGQGTFRDVFRRRR